MNSILVRLTAALFLTSALPAAEISWVTSSVANLEHLNTTGSLVGAMNVGANSPQTPISGDGSAKTFTIPVPVNGVSKRFHRVQVGP